MVMWYVGAKIGDVVGVKVGDVVGAEVFKPRHCISYISLCTAKLYVTLRTLFAATTNI